MEKIEFARVTPERSLDQLSQVEVERLVNTSGTQIHEVFRKCALAVLNTGEETDNTSEILDAYKDFSIEVIPQERGIKLEIRNAPAIAFVDGKMVRGIKEHLFSALRDLIYIDNELKANEHVDLQTNSGVTNSVFHILRNAGVLKNNGDNNLVVCWGGHSIGEIEYRYTKKVGYEMGLRNLDICTGCGPGAMKGPMKGATIGRAKQRQDGRYIGISEPGIIAAESPNPIVNLLVIMPDIEKRLEAFIRCGHGVVVFPGGVGTAEEILYILGVLLHPKNAQIPFPLIFTGPKSSQEYFEQIDEFIANTIGTKAQSLYEIIIDDPKLVAAKMSEKLEQVESFRRENQDAYYFNWVLNLPDDFQKPFKPSHENMANLELHHDQEDHELAANLRKAFSGIVDGNVKEHGIQAVAEKGPYEIRGDKKVIAALDGVLRSFVSQKRMKIPTKEYVPCYRIIT